MARQTSRSKLLTLLALAWPVPLSFILPTACGNVTHAPDASGLPNGVFGGGESGIKDPILAGMSPVGMAGGAGTSSNPIPDLCANVPEGRLALIDDFEDGDSTAAFEADRDAYWFTVTDETAGMIEPAGLFLPALGGAHRSTRAAHVTAAGFSLWGAALAANITHLADGIRCPFNASHFSGLRFYARGTGRARVSLQVPEVVSDEFNGTCHAKSGEVCYDTHGAWITLTSNWQFHSLKWSDFVQRGFGKSVPFRPATLMSVQFTFETQDLPVDARFDDVSWEDGSLAPDPGSGAAGAAGAGSGEAGTAGSVDQGGGPSEAGAPSEGGSGGMTQ